ncbi:MAG: pyruvate kinase [Roseiflexaceae bacterium]
MRRTKIVATIGPSSNTPELIAQLIDAGMNVARLNFSHGTHDEHAKRIQMLREAARQAGRPLAILQDLQGPKIRTGALVNHAPVPLVPGQHFTITTRDIDGTADMVDTTYKALPGDVAPGDRILLSDGLIELRVLSTTHDEVLTQVVFGGMLRENQGINLPGVRVSAPAVTEKDAADLEFGLAHDVDYVAISFVRRAADVRDVKQRIAAAGKSIPVIVKIEKPEALDDLPAILAECDGVMVARGDLGVEMPAEQVPLVQKRLIKAANDAGLPVITATQMLESMIQNPRPTRAEASDVANAILDGTDAVMLSGETANGKFPVEAVQTMARIAEAAEAANPTPELTDEPWAETDDHDIARAMSAAACAIVDRLSVTAIVAFTISGNTARLVSRQRPRVAIFAFTPAQEVYQRLSLVWGVTPLLTPFVDRLDSLGELVSETLISRGLVEAHDMVVITGGHPLPVRGATNFVKVMRLETRG